MRDEVFMAGLGGQGILLAGQLLAQAAINADLEISWYPSYSPEVRGGEATCTLVVADGRVGSPISGRPQAMVLMEPRATKAHVGRCAPEGLAIINTSMGAVDIERNDLRIVRLPANELAVEAGSERAVNMVMLGAYLALTRPELLETVIESLADVLPERHHGFIPMNEEAIRSGARAATASRQE